MSETNEPGDVWHELERSEDRRRQLLAEIAIDVVRQLEELERRATGGTR